MNGETMDSQANEFWNKVSPGLHRARDLSPPTPEEAEADLLAAPANPLPEQRIQDILAFALAGRKPRRKPTELLPDWLRNTDLSTVSQDMVLALARHAGAPDDEVEQVLEQMRREVFEGSDEDGEQESRF